MEQINAYNDKVVRQFTIMTVVWGVIGMLVGVLIASQLIWPVRYSHGSVSQPGR